MSLRRKSCNACFKGRRKCDLGFPTCATCQRTRKKCEYTYRRRISNSPSSSDSGSGWSSSGSVADGSTSTLVASLDDAAPDTLFDPSALNDVAFEQYGQLPEFQRAPAPPASDADFCGERSSLAVFGASPDATHVPRLLGHLGVPLPMQGSNETWQWVVDELKSYPKEFAQHTKTAFINNMPYRDDVPPPLRGALGISAMCCVLNDNNRSVVFRLLSSENRELLNTVADEGSLADELARVQALVLYQIIRYFYGDLEQRRLAEQQQSLINARALKLLARFQADKTGDEAIDWHTWLLAESVRRTVIMAYMVFGANTLIREGVCLGLATLSKLPMSAAFASWDSEADHRRDLESGVTMPYETFNSLWNSFVPRKLDRFEKLLIIPCRGIDAARASESPVSSAV